MVEFDGLDIDGDKLTLEWHVIDNQCIVNPAYCTDVNLFFNRCVSRSVDLKRQSKDDVSALLIDSTSNSPVTSPVYQFNATAYNRTVFTQFDVAGSDLASLQFRAPERCPKFKTTMSMRVGHDRDRYPFDWWVFSIRYLASSLYDFVVKVFWICDRLWPGSINEPIHFSGDRSRCRSRCVCFTRMFWCICPY